MTITYPLDFPDVPIASSRFQLDVNQAVFESSFNRNVSVQSHAGGTTDRWTGVLTTVRLNSSQMADVSAFLVALRGAEGTFRAFDPDRRSPRGAAETASSYPRVKGGGQVGRLLLTDGWKASTQKLLLPGDYVQIGTRFHMVVQPVASDASGNATLEIEPPLHEAPPDNRVVTFENPVLVARLSGAREGWETDNQRHGVISIAFEEAL